MVSEAKKATVKTKTETGLDAVFEFEVIGQVPSRTPTAGSQ